MMMKRRVLLLLGLWLAFFPVVNAQIFTGGRGDGATMSCVPPKVTTLGETDIRCVSETIILAVYATGSNLQYIWQKMGSNFYEDLQEAPHLLGLGTDTLRIVLPVKDRDDGKYRCLVKNTCDIDTSEVFVLNLSQPPHVEVPLSRSDYAKSVCANETPVVDLQSTILSPGNDHKYTWVKIDTTTGTQTTLPDTTSYAHIQVGGAALEAEGLYVVTATNGCGVVSDSVFLPVYRAPEIKWENLVDGEIRSCVGKYLKLQATVSGGGSCYYILEQVYYDVYTGEWSVITSLDMDQPEHAFQSVATSERGYWRWTAINECGESVSERVYLNLEETPSFSLTQPDVYLFPADTIVCEGSTLELMCKATGETTRYYWLKDGERVVDSDSNVLVLRDIKEEDAGNYTCVAYNSCMQMARARSIKVSLTLRPRLQRDPYLPRQVCLGDTLVRFRFQKELDPPVDSMRWIFDGEYIYDGDHYDNTTTEELYVRFGGESDLGLYQVELYNKCGSTVSGVANLYDMALPVSFLKGVEDYDALLCPGKEQRLSVAVSGSAPIHYKWILNEHTYDTDTNFVNVKGQSVSDLNKYTVFAYNACGSAVDTGWLQVERFDYFKFIGSGEVCEDAEPTGHLELQGSDTAMVYTLYRDYGLTVETFKGTGGPVYFENMPAGIYYVTAENKATECIQEMDGRPEIVSLKSPAKFNFFVSSYYCMNDEGNGAELALTGWENGVTYTLQCLNTTQNPDWTNVGRQKFTGGIQHYPLDELNSPDAGEPKVYSNIGTGRYRVVAKNPPTLNQCTRTVVLEDSLYVLDEISRHKLMAVNNDTVNCVRMADGQEYQETAGLEVDRFIEGATYTLYKDGVPDTSHEPDRTAPIGWSGITAGTYKVVIETKQGCKAETNEVRILKVKAPLYQTLSGDNDPCATSDALPVVSQIFVDNTEIGVTYSLYQETPRILIPQPQQGTGAAISFQVPGKKKATYIVIATDATGMCPTTFEDTYSILASDYVVSMNPADIFLDAKGKTTWLHADITGDYVHPLNVEWWQESQLQQTGITNLPDGQYYKHYYWPFCECESKHGYWGETWTHGYGGHTTNCTLKDCPFLYHRYDPQKHGCVYRGTVKDYYERGGRVYYGNKYDLYFCKDGVPDNELSQTYYENDTLNPFRNRLTTPVNEDRKYAITVTDGVGCQHTDTAFVRVMGGKLRAEIIYSEMIRYYEYPFCRRFHQHEYHRCNAGCNTINCPVMYHDPHRFDGCTLLHTEHTPYNGGYPVEYRDYACCTHIEAEDTIVNRNSKLLFCSEARGGDYNYNKYWSFEVPGNSGASWSNVPGDSVVIYSIKESGWLRLRVTSMGQEARDSIWIEVVRQKFVAAIQDVEGHNIDTAKVCRGDELYLYAFTDGGDGQTMVQWYGDGDTGPNTRTWAFKPQQSGNVILTATNDGIVIRDTAYIRLQERPTKPEIENPGTRCVTDSWESIRVTGLDQGANYVLEFSRDSGATYSEYKRLNNVQGNALEFRVNEPDQYLGLFRVKAEGNKDSDACDTYSDVLEFIGQPTHNQMISDSYCYSNRRRGLTLQLNSTDPDMSYSILFDDRTWKETIEAPVNFFDGPLTQGDYYLVYTRKGIRGSCSDTVPINIKEVAPAQDIEIANHTPACEGSNAVLTIPVTEPQVKYYLKASTTGEKLDLFTGNGGERSANIPARSAGSYLVIAELEGCENQVGIFNFYEKPEKIEQEDIHYCYPYGAIANVAGTELEYSGLKPGITYKLIRDGREVAALTGGGTMKFTDVVGGSYLLVSEDNTTGCTSETAFLVDARRSPKDFKLKVDCAKEKNVTLEYSQQNVSYVLYRDILALDTLYGTGSGLSFGVQNVSGKYIVIGTDTLTGCSEKMDGEVMINEIGYCDLIQETQICEAGRSTAVIYPCSKTGWDYYIKNVTDPANPLSSNTISGNGGEITWESMGPGGDFKPTPIGRNQYKPSIYILYGKDVCGDIPLDTLTIKMNTPPKAELEVGSIILNQTVVHRTKTMRGCENEPLEFFLSKVDPGIECILIGLMADNYSDTLTHFVTTAEHYLRTSIGIYPGGYAKYICYLKDGSCRTQLTLSVVYRDLPDTGGILDGTSICEGYGTLDITLSGKVPGQNYYLMREGEVVPLDTILYSEMDGAFNTQTEKGRYYVLTENIDVTPDGLYYTTICRDTLPRTFAIGDAPTKFHFVSWPDRKQELYLCIGEQKRVSLLSSESTVDYALMKDGVEIGGRQHKEGGGRLTFGVTEAGQYTVRGFLGNCEVDMLDTVTVYADSLPNLQLFDKYYYCRDEEGGANIEIEDAPMYTIAELKAGGVSAIPLAIDTVRHRGDTLKFDTRCVVGDIYYLSIRTYGGCQFDHPFTVEKKRPPKDLKVYLTANAICEGECTKVAILGDEGNIEYELRYADGDHSIYNDNFIMGFGDRDTLWFPYAICETGNYQVIATQYDRPYCETILPYNDLETIALQDNDTIHELNFESNDVHYCADDGTLGATIALLDAQAGLEYYLFRGDTNLNRLGFPKIVATTDGERLEWRNVPSTVKCQGEGDFYTTYRVLARNTLSGCEKWMKDSVRIYADSYISGLANSTDSYDFCEGGSVLLKVRAEGCGLQYNWKHIAADGTVTSVGEALPDLWLRDATADMSGLYYCEVSNACNLSTPTINNAWISPMTDVYVRELVEMEDQERIIVCEGTSGIIYSKMLNVSEGDYAWYREDEPGKILSTRSYLSLNHITLDMQGFYVCRSGRVQDGYCNEMYDTLYIEVAKNVDSLKFLPVYDTLCYGEALNLSMVGKVPNEYIGQWYHNGVDMGLQSTGYNKAAVSRADAGVYTVELRRTTGATCGDNRLKTIGIVTVDSLITPLWHTEDKELCQNQKIALSVRTMPMSGVKFEWTRIVDGAPEELVGYGADVLTEVPEGANNVIYKAYYHNKCDALAGSTNTVSTNVNIANNAGFAVNLPSEITGCEGDQPDVTLTVVATSVTVTDYAWIYTPASSTEVDTVDTGTATSNQVSYTVPFDHEHSGFYTCILQTDCGRITSDACWVRVNSPATITGDLTAANGKMCEGSYFTPSLTATGSDLQFRWFVTYPDGQVDTVRRAIGYDWEAVDKLDLLTETKYNGAKLQCRVWNNCREDVSEEVNLEIIAPRDINVVPAETWLCFDSTATVEVELLGGDGDAWSYKLQRNDYGPAAYNVDAGFTKDTVEGLISGKYSVINLNDGICDYRDKVMAEFMVNDVPQGSVSFSMASGRKDTLLCFGRSLPMVVKVNGGTGPFEVSIYYKTAIMTEPALYNGWVNSNPFVISAAAARQGYHFSMNIMENAEFSVQVVDLANDKVLTGCPLDITNDQMIRVTMESQMTPPPFIGLNGGMSFGECELDIDLRLKLNVTPPNGTFHIVKQLGGGRTSDTIHRGWEFAKILRTDGPGLYSIGYSLNNTCRDAATPVMIKIDSLPYVTLTPADTTLCCNINFVNVQAHLHGAAPFSELRIEKHLLKTDGHVGVYPLPVYNSPSNPQYIPSGMAWDCSDSIIRYVATYVKDKYGCVMPVSKQVEAKIEARKQPLLEVVGYHPAYSGGYGDAVTETYNLHEGDSVTFRVSLSSRTSPWTLNFSYLQTPPPAVPHEQFTVTVSGVDTLITVKKEGWYIFTGSEISACSSSEVTRSLRLTPPGMISIEGLFLGGALSHLYGMTPVDLDYMRMKSGVWNAPGFPDYGYDHAAYTAHLHAGGQPAIDWIFVEARKHEANGDWTLIDRDTCILLADGTVRNRKMERALKFEGTGVSDERFYVAVFHRNHLPAMTAHAEQFGPSSPTQISFGRKANFYFDGSRYMSQFDDHYWNFWSYYGQPIYVLAPSYKQINTFGQLVSMSNAVQTYLQLENSASMKTNLGYYIWDVTCNGYVEIPAILGSFTQLPNGGQDEDAWMLFKNRDRFTEIDDFFTP